ncbi:MAG: acyl-CoA dehydrogenase [Bacteroidetes bacterium]|nr:MAG: acyl-CoA dehydrogenase [Bacteroidota bacterium]
MADQYISMDTLRYLLYQVHGLEQLLEKPRFQDFDKEAIDIYLNSVKSFSDEELFPYFREMDEKPVVYEDGKVIVHPQIQKIMQQSSEMGLIGGTFDYEQGGMQMPYTVLTAAYFIMDAANNHVPGYPGLTDGAAHLIVSFGEQELQEMFVPKMISGDWGGTMCLTEPQAGSSLSDISTTAYPQPDGRYKIKGQKIFISGGDTQFSENIVHLLLARVEGAPPGTKGVSLFVVPKNRPVPGGGLEPNDVTSVADFPKMGQRGYATVHLAFGDQDDCYGWLVGEENKGLGYMFQMMNGARIAVGRAGAAVATAAYYASLQYANERPQGRKLRSDGKKDPSEGQTLIINHPDVRRMLLLQKAIWEGSLSLVLQSAVLYDWETVSEGEEREQHRLLLELLTPVTKTYPSEMGRESVSNGLQVLGGYGFCSEFVLQQYYRDVRIMAIYEGTTGIQSLDLLGRKIPMKQGQALKLLAADMQATIKEAMAYDELKPYAQVLGEKMQLNQKVLEFLMPFAMKGDYERFLSDATVFMEFFGTILIAWQWLKMALKAKQGLLTGDKTYTPEFYESKIHTMKFYFKYEMPKTNALAQTLMDEEVLTIAREKELIG